MNFTMTTSKKRINITLPDDVDEFLTILAKRDKVPKATKVITLLQAALEFEEDMILSRIADERVESSKGQKFLSHEEFWS